MHHYKTAREAIASAIERSTADGWSEKDILGSLITAAIEGLQEHASGDEIRSMLEFELSNIRGTVDFDFVRSR
jgi:hypothetical protein